jgi:Cu+-exporting ATPase
MAKTFTDPVCGMQVTAETAAAHMDYMGTTYYFCSQADKNVFERDPEKFVKTSKEPMPR